MTPDTAGPGASWPPAPKSQTTDPVDEALPAASSNPAGEALHLGWRLLVLGLCCAPPVFLPLAAWQGFAASKARVGAGTRLLLATGGVCAFWLSALLLLYLIRE